MEKLKAGKKRERKGGVRKKGINPKTGRPYAKRKSGLVQAECVFFKTVKQNKHKTVSWPDQLKDMKDGMYLCRITSKGKQIVVNTLEEEFA